MADSTPQIYTLRCFMLRSSKPEILKFVFAYHTCVLWIGPLFDIQYIFNNNNLSTFNSIFSTYSHKP